MVFLFVPLYKPCGTGYEADDINNPPDAEWDQAIADLAIGRSPSDTGNRN